MMMMMMMSSMMMMMSSMIPSSFCIVDVVHASSSSPVCHHHGKGGRPSKKRRRRHHHPKSSSSSSSPSLLFGVCQRSSLSLSKEFKVRFFRRVDLLEGLCLGFLFLSFFFVRDHSLVGGFLRCFSSSHNQKREKKNRAFEIVHTYTIIIITSPWCKCRKRNKTSR